VPDGSGAGIQGDAVLTGSGNLRLYLAPGLYEGQGSVLLTELEGVLDYVKHEGGFDKEPTAPFEAAIMNDSSCSLRGAAYTQDRRAHVFTCNDLPSSRAVAILAHEFVHQLAADHYGDSERTADTLLAEGLATWAAGKYWRGDHPDFRSYVRAQRAAGVSYPLQAKTTVADSEAMDAIYYQRASFVLFLIDTYGREMFDEVYRTGNFAAGSASYNTVYGMSIDQLEKKWQDWLNQ
jgi:hypothetical protein